jgi:uncharacterized membrane protein
VSIILLGHVAEVDHCAFNPCVFGSCFNGRTGYNCVCQQHYTGRNCSGIVKVIIIILLLIIISINIILILKRIFMTLMIL